LYFIKKKTEVSKEEANANYRASIISIVGTENIERNSPRASCQLRTRHKTTKRIRKFDETAALHLEWRPRLRCTANININLTIALTLHLHIRYLLLVAALLGSLVVARSIATRCSSSLAGPSAVQGNHFRVFWRHHRRAFRRSRGGGTDASQPRRPLRASTAAARPPATPAFGGER